MKPETMSTQALEELLREDFYARDGGASDMGELLRAAEELARREPGPERWDADRAWKLFVREYRPFALSARRRFSRALRAAAVLAAVIVLVTTTAAAMGYDLWGILAGWTDESLYLQPEQIVPIRAGDITLPEEKREYAGLQEALGAYGFSQRVQPRWVPEGYGLESVVVEDGIFPYMLIFLATYQRGDEYLYVSVDVHIDNRGEGVVHWQKDAEEPEAYRAGGRTYVISVNAGKPYALWADSPLECCVYGDVTREELERMIDSLSEG